MDESEDCDLPLETVKILLKNPNVSIKKQCLDYLLLVAAKPDTCKELYGDLEIIVELFRVVCQNDNTQLVKIALDALINISSITEGARAIFEGDMENEWKSRLVIQIFKQAVDKDNQFSLEASQILANMTIPENLATQIARTLSDEDSLSSIYKAIHNKLYNPKCRDLSQYLCQVVGNLTQSDDFQTYLLTAEEGRLFTSILPVLHNGDNFFQKRGIASAIYNCLFNSKNHCIILHSPFNILGYLLLPLAGPEEFDDDEVEKMPIELQYLGNDKEREEDTEVRRLILKSLLMLCTTKEARLFLREQQVYLILREYHKWEKDPSLVLACENVVDILIRTEEEIGTDNIKIIDVPTDLQQKFEKLDADFINTFDTNT